VACNAGKKHIFKRLLFSSHFLEVIINNFPPFLELKKLPLLLCLSPALARAAAAKLLQNAFIPKWHLWTPWPMNV
jgi:hypothetical protein